MLEFGVLANPHSANPLINSSKPSGPSPHPARPASKRTTAEPVTVLGLPLLLQALLHLRLCLRLHTHKPSIHHQAHKDQCALLTLLRLPLLLLLLSIISRLLRLENCLSSPLRRPSLLLRCDRPDHRPNETLDRWQRKSPLSPFPQNIGSSSSSHAQLPLPRPFARLQQPNRRVEEGKKGHPGKISVLRADLLSCLLQQSSLFRIRKAVSPAAFEGSFPRLLTQLSQSLRSRSNHPP